MRENWTETTLGEVMSMSIGGIWGGEPGTDELDVAVYRQTEFDNNGRLSIPSDATRSISKSQLKSRQLQAGDILLQKSAGTPTLPGRVVVVPDGIEQMATCSNFLQLIRADTTKCEPRFLFWELWFRHKSGGAFEFQRGTNIRNLDLNQYFAQCLSLPPLEAQRRIVDLVTSVDSYIAALQQQADAARVARAAVLSELLSAGGEDWTETTLGDISDFVSLKVTPANLDSATPYVGLEHLVPRSIEISEWDTVASVSSNVTPFEPGDTLFGRLRPYLHKVALAEFPGTCSPELLVLRSNAKCDAGFLYLLCALDSTIRKCVAMSAGTRMPRTSTSDLASIEVPLPPIIEQRRIVSVISSLDEVIRSTEQAVAESMRLRSGLLSELLSGNHEIPESYDRLLGAA